MDIVGGKFYDALEYAGSKYFLEGILNQISSTNELVSFIHRYSVFNGNFAGGVANLAGAFHIRQDLFRDSNEKLTDCADKSSEVASHIFFAAEDEYADRYSLKRFTHRDLGQILLKETVLYFEIDLDSFDQKFFTSPAIREILTEVVQGYRVNRKNSEEDLFHALGFHIGAELLADQEFSLIDEYLTKNYPGLVGHLKSTLTVNGINAYRWIELHTKVEVEHFDHAVTAAEKAKDYYCGTRHTKDEVENMIFDGFMYFAEFQQRFFDNILKG